MQLWLCVALAQCCGAQVAMAVGGAKTVIQWYSVMCRSLQNVSEACSLLDALRMTPKVRINLHMSSRSISMSGALLDSCAWLSVELQKLDYDICLGVCQCACLLTQPWLPLLSRMSVTHNSTLCSMLRLQMCQKSCLKISRDHMQ